MADPRANNGTKAIVCSGPTHGNGRGVHFDHTPAILGVGYAFELLRTEPAIARKDQPKIDLGDHGIEGGLLSQSVRTSNLLEQKGCRLRWDYEGIPACALSDHLRKLPAHVKYAENSSAGSTAVQNGLAHVREQQRQLAQRRHRALAVLRREPELIGVGNIEFIAHALVVPSSNPIDREQYEAKTDEVAMALAWAMEESEGAIVKDVHTPELARQAGLPDYPGFDLWSIRPNEKRCIEVKGRADTGEIEISANEWARACNLPDQYWLYVVYECATPNPRLVRIQDPFDALLAKAKTRRTMYA